MDSDIVSRMEEINIRVKEMSDEVVGNHISYVSSQNTTQ